MFDWFRRMNEDQAKKVVTYCSNMIYDRIIEALEEAEKEED